MNRLIVKPMPQSSATPQHAAAGAAPTGSSAQPSFTVASAVPKTPTSLPSDEAAGDAEGQRVDQGAGVEAGERDAGIGEAEDRDDDEGDHVRSACSSRCSGDCAALVGPRRGAA